MIICTCAGSGDALQNFKCKCRKNTSIYREESQIPNTVYYEGRRSASEWIIWKMGYGAVNSVKLLLMRKYAIASFILILIGIDAITKYYSELYLALHEYRPIFWEYLGFELSYNVGIAFSLPIEWIFLKVLTVLLLGGILYYYIHDEYQKKSRLLDIWYGFILAWAIGHTYERLFVGHVIDFIAVKYFAILNFADIFISVGALFLVIAYGIYSRTRT